MKVAFSTVVRAAPLEAGGELVLVDWATQQVLGRRPIIARDPDVADTNPRGGPRGGRGIVRWRDEIVVAGYHSLYRFDLELGPRGRHTHGLMVGLHELFLRPDETVWVAATNIEAALRFDLTSGALLEAYWPLDSGRLQRELGVEPLEIDKDADNRARPPGTSLKPLSHLHLNAICEFDNEVYALLHAKSAVVNLTRESVVFTDRHLHGGHNLIIRDGIAYINDSRRSAVCEYDVVTGSLLRRIELRSFPWVRKMARGHDMRYALRRLGASLGLRGHTPPRPLFGRGLDIVGDSMFVGLSPAAVIEVDVRSGRFVSGFRYGNDVRMCVHGLRVVEV